APEPLDVHPNRSIKEDGTRLSYLSPSSPRTLPKVPGTSQFEFGPVLPSSPQLEVLYEDPKEDVVSILSEEERTRLAEVKKDKDLLNEDIWTVLEEEIRDINLLIKQISNLAPVKTQCKRVYDTARTQCTERTGPNYSPSTVYPMAGAVLGTCLGGPVGLLAGVKIGGLAAIGGSIFGYSTGSLIKEHTDRQDYISDFYSKHQERNMLARLTSEKRTISLPEVLEDDFKKLKIKDELPTKSCIPGKSEESLL
ncbi:uncharacterized protein LOC111717000, partial [Eurytemora carolleeae]|uniref:uncharacterized protein LOC111717000 n=1 Tax=Eurytemora carolleeae TaxID=1294199 RepID=UPI000C76EEB4